MLSLRGTCSSVDISLKIDIEFKNGSRVAITLYLPAIEKFSMCVCGIVRDVSREK